MQCPLVSGRGNRQWIQDCKCWAVGKIVVITCLSGDLWLCWTLRCLDVQDAAPCCFASRRYSTAREGPQLHLCMHRQTNACVHFSSCRNHIFTTSLCRVPCVFKHTHLLPMHVHTVLQHTNWESCFRGKSFIEVLFWFGVLGLCNSLINPLIAKFPPSLQLPFSCVTYLSGSQLCRSGCLSTLASHGLSVFIFIWFPLSKIGAFFLPREKTSRSHLNIIPFFCNNQLQLHFLYFLSGGNGLILAINKAECAYFIFSLTFTSPLWFLLIIWTFISCSN